MPVGVRSSKWSRQRSHPGLLWHFISRVSSELWCWASPKSESWTSSWQLKCGPHAIKDENTHENILRQTHTRGRKRPYCCSCCRGGACPVARGSWPARLLWTSIWPPPVLPAAAAAAAARRFSSSETLGERPSMRLGRFPWSYLPGKSGRLPSGLGIISSLWNMPSVEMPKGLRCGTSRDQGPGWSDSHLLIAWRDYRCRADTWRWLPGRRSFRPHRR